MDRRAARVQVPRLFVSGPMDPGDTMLYQTTANRHDAAIPRGGMVRKD